MTAPVRGVIINADDFGLTPGVNRGIVSAFRDGVLTSTTMLVNLRFFDDAVAGSREPRPAGGHPPVVAVGPSGLDPSPRSRRWSTRDGRFPRSLGTLAPALLPGPHLEPDEVELELPRADPQVPRRGPRRRPTWTRTSTCTACPASCDALIAVAGEFGIDRVASRSSDPTRPTWPRPAARFLEDRRGKRQLIGAFSAAAELAQRRRARRAGVRTTDHFVGIEHMDCLNSEVFRAHLE